jgi:FSR family fosmidomycin resistance protein-like MFS transporter
VDGVCAAALYGLIKPAATDGMAFFRLVALYNLLAFPLQALVGFIADCIPKKRVWLAAVMLAFPLLWLPPFPPVIRAAALGLCNSMFHVLGGIDTLEASRGKMAALGVFVSPGAVGLAVGLAFPPAGLFMSAALAVLAIGYLFVIKTGQEKILPLPALNADNGNMSILLPLLALISVVFRGMGGSVVTYSWKIGFVLPIIFAVIVAGGKAAGGLFSDIFGEKRVAVSAAAAAALILPLSADIPPLAMLGQFSINLTMPVTLMLLYRVMPRYPGFSFGLAASMLYPGTLIGRLINGAIPEHIRVPALFVIFGANAAILVFVFRKNKKSIYDWRGSYETDSCETKI